MTSDNPSPVTDPAQNDDAPGFEDAQDGGLLTADLTFGQSGDQCENDPEPPPF
jgi:hypothetical protein